MTLSTTAGSFQTQTCNLRRRLSRFTAVAFALLVMSAMSESARAQTGFCYAAADSENRLVRINEDGSGFLDIGDLGVSAIEAIAVQPGTEILYASNDLGSTGELGVIDPATGAFASIGTHGTCRESGGSTHAVDDVDSLEFDALTGILWGIDRSTVGGVLLQIDPLTGAVVPDVFGPNVSCVSISSTNGDIDDLAIDPKTGTMYGIDSGSAPDDLVTIDTTTGVATLVGSMGVNDMEGMGYSPEGTLYGTTGSGTESLYTIDTTTGLATLVTAFPSLNDYEGVDCLVGVTASTGDFVWLDVDGDGVQDFGEPGFANVLVQLFVDNNGDGLPDDLDTPPDGTPDAVKQTVTDANGRYLFDDLPPNDYIVSVDPTTLPNGGAGLTSSTGGTSTAVTLSQGENDLTTDFGFTNSVAGTALIGDKVWTDVDADGLQDPGEIGLAGVTVNLVDPGPDTVLGGGDDTLVATTTTAADGRYLFVTVAPDDYVVEIDSGNFGPGGPLENYTVTTGPQSPGADNSGTFTIAADNAVLDADFGYDTANLFSISDRIYLDQDWDGTQEAGEPGIFLVTVSLFDSNGDVIVTTDANGDFSFPGVPDGDYTIRVTDTTDRLNGLRGTTAAGIANSLAVTVSGANISAVSFGYGELGFIGDTVYSDANGNGVQDSGEAGIGAVTVELRDAIGNPIDSDPAAVGIQPTVITSAPDGFYKFQKVGGGQTADYRDNFDAIAYDGTNGSFNWQPSPWAEIDETGGGVSGGRIRVLASANCAAGNCLEIDPRRSGDNVHRQADLSTAASAVLNFDFNNQLVASGTIGNVLSSFGAPSSGSFGVAWDGTNLWVADDATALIYEVTRAGTVVSSFAAPCGFPKGVTFDGTNLWVGCDGTDLLYEMTTTGTIVSTIPTPAGTVRGVAWDGIHLWVADSGTDRVYELTTTGTVVSSFATLAGVTDPRGLTFDGVHLWLANNSDGGIYQLTTTGTALSRFITPGTSPRGLTFDGTDFWLSDNNTDLIYQLGGPTNVVAEVSGDGGGNWTTLASYSSSNSGSGNANFDITPFIAANTRIRFLVANPDGGGAFFVDNVQIFLIQQGAAGPTTYTVVVTDTGSVLTGFTQTGDPDEAGVCAVCDDQGTASVGNFLQDDNSSSDLSMDFGYQSASTGTITGALFEDSDLDGIDDGAGDPPLAGIVVNLLDGSGNVVATTVTDVNGSYTFSGVIAGTYTVAVDETTLPANLNTQTATPGSVVVGVGETVSDVDFGFGQIVTTPVTLGSFKAVAGPNEGDVEFRWSTVTETGNVGFNLYVKHAGVWSRVNPRPIPSPVGDAVTVQHYRYTATGVVGRVCALEDVDG